MVRGLLSDKQWRRIEQMLPGKPRDVGRSGADNRLFVEAVLWIARTGSPWRDPPDEFGNWNGAYVRFARWSSADVWQSVFATLSKDADFREAMIDSTIVRAHQHAAGAPKKNRCAQALGRSRGGLTSNLHVVADRRGRPALGTLTAGQVNDVMQALPLLSGLHLGALIGDKAYDTGAVIEPLRAIGARAVIPSRSHRLHPRRYSRSAYRRRNLIERCFGRLKQFRRIATGYEKLAERFVSFICLVAALCWVS